MTFLQGSICGINSLFNYIIFWYVTFSRGINGTMLLTKQREIMDTLYGAMFASIEGDFDKAECEFSYEISEDGSYSVGSSFYYELNGKIFHCPLSGQALGEVSVAVPALHKLMKEAGQGNWDSFTMSFPRDGAVSLKFHNV